MDDIVELQITSELGLSYPLGNVACSMVYRANHPGTLTDGLLAWYLSVPLDGLKELFDKATEQVAALPAPNNTIEAVAALDPVRNEVLDQALGEWSQIRPETRKDFAVDIQSGLFAVYFCDYVNHERNYSAAKVAKAWGVEGVDVSCIMQVLDELPLMSDDMVGLQRYVNENRNQYQVFVDAVQDAGYVRSVIQQGFRVSIDEMAMAVYYLKNNNERMDYERVCSALKIDRPEILGELYKQIQQKPIFQKGGLEAIYNYVKARYKPYKEFYAKVQNAEMYIYPSANGMIERKVGLRSLIAMRLLEQQHKIDTELVRKMWNMTPEGWANMLQKMRSSSYVVFNNLDLPVLPDTLCERYAKEIKALLKEYEQEYGDAYSTGRDNPEGKQLSEMNEEELIVQVRKHPDVLAGVQKKQLTRRIILEAVRANGFALQHVPLKYVTLPLCREAVSNAGASLRYVPQRYRNNFELCRIAVKQEPLAYPYVPKPLRADQRLIDLAITRKQGGYNLLYVPKKSITARVVRRAARTTSVKELYALYEQTQKMHKMSEANMRLVQDYNLLMYEQAVPCLGVRNIPEESMELFHERYNQVRDFYEGKLNAEELAFSINWPAFYNDLTPLQLHTQVFIDLFPIVQHTPEVLPDSPLQNEEPIELPVNEALLKGAFEDWCAKERLTGGILKGVRINDPKQARPALEALMRMDAQLATAYRQKQITSRDYFAHPLRNNGLVNDMYSEFDSVKAANQRAEFWNPANIRRESAKKLKR